MSTRNQQALSSRFPAGEQRATAARSVCLWGCCRTARGALRTHIHPAPQALLVVVLATEDTAVVAGAAAAAPAAFGPNPSVTAEIVPVVGAPTVGGREGHRLLRNLGLLLSNAAGIPQPPPSTDPSTHQRQPPAHLRERPAGAAAAEVAGAEEFAMDANSDGPDSPRREFATVVAGTVDVAGAPVGGAQTHSGGRPRQPRRAPTHTHPALPARTSPPLPCAPCLPPPLPGGQSTEVGAKQMQRSLRPTRPFLGSCDGSAGRQAEHREDRHRQRNCNPCGRVPGVAQNEALQPPSTIRYLQVWLRRAQRVPGLMVL